MQGVIVAKKLIKHGKSVALIIDKKTLQTIGADEESSFDIEIRGKQLIVKPIRAKTKIQKETFNQMADRLMDKYEPLLKKLAKT